MGNLFLSFTIAIGGAIGLVTLSRVFDLETYSSRVFPLIPILYAIIYEVLERRKTGKSQTIPPSQAREEMRAGAKALFKNITPGRIITDVAVSFAIKFSAETLLVALFISTTGQSFESLYGNFGVDTVGRLLRGDHPWLMGTDGLILLGLIALLTSIGTGLWIGNTTQGQAILEGVVAGAAVTFITAMTNMLMLYRRIEEAANQMAASFGYGIHVGFAAVLLVQVLLYGLWSGVAQKSKEKKALRAEVRKSAKKQKK
ncbi:MAG TPA: hypothetical protein VL197_10165 [Nitrospirota bacterium]|nr:hypothetical protein [Nitrospirota bacterium]